MLGTFRHLTRIGLIMNGHKMIYIYSLIFDVSFITLSEKIRRCSDWQSDNVCMTSQI